MSAIAWTESWMQRMCEKMPHSDRWNWPASLTIKDVYAYYKDAMEAEDKEHYSYGAFSRLLGTHFSHCSRADANTDFKCNDCLQLYEKIVRVRHQNRDGKFDEKLQALEIARNTHIKNSDAQRQKKQKHDEKARKWPLKYLSIIIDVSRFTWVYMY